MKPSDLANMPAFPGEKDVRFGQPNDCNPGQSLRQHYAGLALQGVMTGATHGECAAALGSAARATGVTTNELIAIMCREAADALIAELAKPVQP